jgi:hypothetical protein
VDFGSTPCGVDFTKSGGKLEMTKTKEILRRIELKHQLIEITKGKIAELEKEIETTKWDITELEKELEASDGKRASL